MRLEVERKEAKFERLLEDEELCQRVKADPSKCYPDSPTFRASFQAGSDNLSGASGKFMLPLAGGRRHSVAGPDGGGDAPR